MEIRYSRLSSGKGTSFHCVALPDLVLTANVRSLPSSRVRQAREPESTIFNHNQWEKCVCNPVFKFSVAQDVAAPTWTTLLLDPLP
jgi:hypothetical protein